MKIISNLRYKKLREIEEWEEVKEMRGHGPMPSTESENIEKVIQWTLMDNIPEFLSTKQYSKFLKIKKGEIGKLFGKSIIVK